MSYLTLEVTIDHGRVLPAEPEKLPEKANGLLTILEPASPEAAQLTPVQALEALQKHLQMDQDKASKWIAAVGEARR